uniref:Uncharacterized protein n=1 Tax=Caenorhabditis japonica TaxID=281687 RepID=A0A8R1EQR3_CAEJA
MPPKKQKCEPPDQDGIIELTEDENLEMSRDMTSFE